MKASLAFRAAAVLIVLFAAGHTFGFWQVDPHWGIADLITAMKTSQFRTQGFRRTYWDFYLGFGFFVSILLFLAALLAWRLGGASAPMWPTLRPIAWALTGAFALIVLLCIRYFFAAPIAFSSLIFLCLLLGTLAADRNFVGR